MILEEVELIFVLSMLLLSGYALGILAKKVKLPEITGYIGAGIILKQAIFWLGLMSDAKFTKLFSRDLVPINHLALALIAFAVCRGLRLEQMKRLGKGIICIASVQAIVTFVAVVIGVAVIGAYADLGGAPAGSFMNVLPIALVFGGIATATAPAATIAVIRELRAKGPFTTTLLATVAIDDAIALLIFAFGITMAESLLTMGVATAGYGAIGLWLRPLVEVVGSVGLGLLVGVAHHFVAAKVVGKVEMMTVSLGIITFASGLSMLLGLSPLLVIMAAGFVLANIARRNQRIFASIEGVQGPIFVIFFTLAGAQLHLENLLTCGIIGAVFFVFRLLGKVSGAYLGASVAQVKGPARRYLGLALLPQAGVAIGLMLVAQESPHLLVYGSVLVDVVLASVALNELIGPPLAAYALRRSGEVPISSESQTSKTSGASEGRDDS